MRRMMPRLMTLGLVLSLAACSPQGQDELARAAARSATFEWLVERLPGVPVQ